MINHTHKFVFLKLSKSASTTISATLKEACIDTIFEKTGHHHILDMISSDTKSYFKFTTVRNPYARLVSRYFFARKVDKHANQFKNLTFKHFVLGGHTVTPMNTTWVLETAPHLKRLLNRVGFFDNQIEWMQDTSGKVIIDFVMKTEALQQDFDILCDKIGIPKQQLPHKNKTKHKHYTEYYDDETREAVAKKYAKDIEYFGYEFGE
tara:strand:+ start:33 stop:653 length:621 start_codon:yes stop_codon:yes gene_type:complete